MNRAALAKLLQPAVVISVAAIIAVAAVAIAYIYTNHKPSESYVAPTVGEIVQEVDATGNVQAATSLDLSFQSGGAISYAGPAVGTHVAAGAVLGRLSGADLSAQLEGAQAALAMQQAKLQGLQQGATPQSVNASQTAVGSAQSGLAQANQGILTAIQSAYVYADAAIDNDVDQFISNPHSVTPTLELTLSNSQYASSIISGRIQMEQLLAQWQLLTQSLPADTDTADIQADASTTQNYAAQVSAYLDTVAAGLTTAAPNTNYPLPTIQGYETTIATARGNMTGAISALNTAESAQTTAEAGLASAQAGLEVTTEPATQSDLQAQEAEVQSAQAQVDLVDAQIGQTVITAPISGTITINNENIGETAAPGSPLISMDSDTQFQMVIYVSEADIAKVKVGDVAQVTLDAYQSEAPFPAHVVQIDPAATVTNGVSSYKITLQFDQNDPRIQSGMTGSVRIITQTDENAVSVPTSAVITRGGDTFVIIQSPSGDKEVQVTTGIQSAAGMTEITSGLSSDQMVRTFGNGATGDDEGTTD